MMYGCDGERYVLILTPAENRRLLAREPVIKDSADWRGPFRITVTLTRPRKRGVAAIESFGPSAP